MEGKVFARIGAVIFVAVAITATAIEMARQDEAPAAWSSARPVEVRSDPLRDELIRCQMLGEGGPRDRACLRAWAENRHRFLAPGARPAERLPTVEPTPADQQGQRSDLADRPMATPAAPMASAPTEEGR